MGELNSTGDKTLQDRLFKYKGSTEVVQALGFTETMTKDGNLFFVCPSKPTREALAPFQAVFDSILAPARDGQIRVVGKVSQVSAADPTDDEIREWRARAQRNMAGRPAAQTVERGSYTKCYFCKGQNAIFRAAGQQCRGAGGLLTGGTAAGCNDWGKSKTWIRPTRLQTPTNVIHTDHHARYSDIRQNGLGSCWLQAEMASLAKSHPKFPYRLIQPSETPGFWDVTLYRMGNEKVVVTVDEYFPQYKLDIYEALGHFQDEAPVTQYWSELVEKAYSALCHGYP